MILGLALYGYDLGGSAFALNLLGDRMPLGDSMFRAIMIVGVLMLVAPSVALAIYGVLPSTQKHFANAREAMAEPPRRPGGWSLGASDVAGNRTTGN